MYLKTETKKIQIKELVNFKDRIKTFRFKLDKINYGIKLPNKKTANTYLFCQRIDICLTDKNNKIIGLYENVKSEKIIRKRKTKNVYLLPLDTVKELQLGQQINLVK